MENFTIISTYTDHDALDGGMLWPLSTYDRITSNLGHKLENFQRGKLDLATVLGVARRWIMDYGKQARRVYDLNLDGGIWVGALHLAQGGAWMNFEPNTKLEHDSLSMIRVWMLPNELGGLTLMLPEDY